jgi:hypothetical protein
MFISYSKARRINESSCLSVAGLDCCTTDAEHPRQQQWHIYIVYVPPHAPCPWFGMLVMFRAMAAEVGDYLLVVKISGVWGPLVLYLRLLNSFWMRFFATNFGGTMSWGAKPCFSALESGYMTPIFIPNLSRY